MTKLLSSVVSDSHTMALTKSGEVFSCGEGGDSLSYHNQIFD